MSLQRFAQALVIASAGACIPIVTHAQNVPAARDAPPGRTWVSAGAGGGWVRVNCTICRTKRFGGPAAVLRVGRTLNPRLLVAAELDGWTRSSNDVRSMLVAGHASMWTYPFADRPLFLQAGAGLVHYRLDENAGTNLFGLVLGAGYELPVGESLRITNSVGLIATSFGSIASEDGAVAEDVSLSVLRFGIALTRR